MSASVTERYETEIRTSGLIEHLEEQAAFFWDTVRGETQRGQRYNTGRVTGRDGYQEGLRLYGLVRGLGPRVAVETGVCNGVSTAFLLLALERNGSGELHSIDLPEVAGEEYAKETFWDGKGGAVIPPGKEPGWMVPAELGGGGTSCSVALRTSCRPSSSVLARSTFSCTTASTPTSA